MTGIQLTCGYFFKINHHALLDFKSGGWRDTSRVKSTLTLIEHLDLIPSTDTTAHNNL